MTFEVVINQLSYLSQDKKPEDWNIRTKIEIVAKKELNLVSHSQLIDHKARRKIPIVSWMKAFI